MTIHWIGDSTVQYNDITTWPQQGMGQALGLYLQPGVMVEDHARNGRSTVSFRAEGYWQAAAARLRPGAPCIDLTDASRRLVEALGDARSRALYMALPAGVYPAWPDGLEDNTHLRAAGAAAFAGLVAAGLWRLGGAYRAPLLPLPDLYAAPPEHWPIL